LLFAGWILDRIDPVRRLSDVVVVAALLGDDPDPPRRDLEGAKTLKPSRSAILFWRRSRRRTALPSLRQVRQPSLGGIMLVVEWLAPLGRKGSEKKENDMRLLYIVTKGMEDPTLASVPLHIAANGSLDIGQEVSVVLAGDATDLVIEENIQRLEGVGVPPARELLGKLREHEVPVYV
jgi:hypothetical protein